MFCDISSIDRKVIGEKGKTNLFVDGHFALTWHVL